MRKLTIVFFDAGGGHRNAAIALKGVIEQQWPWQVELLNLQEMLDTIDPLQNIAHIRVEDGYNLLMRNGWTLFAPLLLMTLQGVIRTLHRPIVRALERHCRRNHADLVLSVIPNFNRALAESIRGVLPGTPFVTLMTDFFDYPPHFWIERESQYVICGTQRARDQAIDIGIRPECCFRISGMLLAPRFYQTAHLDRTIQRQQLGLRPDLPTALVLFGGQGSPVMLRIAEALQQSQMPLQMILICGRNEGLARRIRQISGPKPMFVEGFTDQVNSYMSISDFFIGKPGPGSISEALHFNLPVIVERNRKTLPQERYNTDWIRENEVGVVLKSFGEIEPALRDLLRNGELERLQANAAAHQNRAVFEAVDILSRLMPAGDPADEPRRQTASVADDSPALQACTDS
jgi:hypothetical protein